MINLDTEICVCNSLSVKDIAQCIKDNDLKSLEDMIENRDMPMGDKCGSCKDEGFSNDGYNLPMVLSMVNKGMI